jgi:precorrin-6B methylase 2
MYKVSFISGGTSNIGTVLTETIDRINNQGGIIVNMLQSQSSSPESFVIVTITILWRVG